MSAVWILGAAGRVGRAVAAELAHRQVPVVLVDRDPAGLRELAERIGEGTRIIPVDTIADVLPHMHREDPAVVANFVGPFTETALPFLAATAPGGHYLDLANELPALITALAYHDEAIARQRCIVTASGFGVLGTESIVLKLCKGRGPADTVRVYAIPYLENADIALGPSVAATVVEVLAYGGRRYERGKLVRVWRQEYENILLPDGMKVTTGSGRPSGDVEAAHRASGAPFATGGSRMGPSGPVARMIMPMMSTLLTIPALRRVMKRRLAAVTGAVESGPHSQTWAHARVTWADGSRRTGWLRAGDALDFTIQATTAVACRLWRGEGKPGAYTPGALFGPELAIEAGGEFIVE